MSGDPRSPCYPIFEELKFIENLINGLDGGVVSWNTDETASDKVITDLKNLLLFCKMQSLSVAYDSSGLLNIACIFVIKLGNMTTHEISRAFYLNYS